MAKGALVLAVALCAFVQVSIALESYNTVEMTDAAVAELTNEYTALEAKQKQRLSQLASRVAALESVVKQRAAPLAQAMNPIPGGQLAGSLQADTSGGQQATVDVPPPPTGGSQLITADQLCCAMKADGKALSSSKCNEYISYLNAALNEGQINTKTRIAAFLAQIGHESASLKWWTELGGPSYFRKYDGRKDLGNNQPGDGYRFRGRGPIQLTGRNNYQKAGQALGVNLTANPDVVSKPTMGFRTTVWYWTTRKLNRYCDGTQSKFKTLTRRINGGTNGWNSRLHYWAQAKKCLGA